MNAPRIHPPSLLLGALLSLGLAAASAGGSASRLAATSARQDQAATGWQLVVSENNGRRYLLESATGRLFQHEGERWVLAAQPPE